MTETIEDTHARWDREDADDRRDRQRREEARRDAEDAPWTPEDQRRFDELLQIETRRPERTTAAEAYEFTCLCSRRDRARAWDAWLADGWFDVRTLTGAPASL